MSSALYLNDPESKFDRAVASFKDVTHSGKCAVRDLKLFGDS